MGQLTSVRTASTRVSKITFVVECQRQFIHVYAPPKGYSDDIKRECVEVHLNGMGFHGIERVKGVHHTTIIYWVKQRSQQLPDAPETSDIPAVGELDELETFVGSKKTLIWLWTAVHHFTPGILGWTLGDRSAETFKLLWHIVRCWHSYFYVTDGYRVYPCFIDAGDQIVSKTYMTRVESENTRLLYYSCR